MVAFIDCVETCGKLERLQFHITSASFCGIRSWRRPSNSNSQTKTNSCFLWKRWVLTSNTWNSYNSLFFCFWKGNWISRVFFNVWGLRWAKWKLPPKPLEITRKTPTIFRKTPAKIPQMSAKLPQISAKLPQISAKIRKSQNDGELTFSDSWNHWKAETPEIFQEKSPGIWNGASHGYKHVRKVFPRCCFQVKCLPPDWTVPVVVQSRRAKNFNEKKKHRIRLSIHVHTA